LPGIPRELGGMGGFQRILELIFGLIGLVWAMVGKIVAVAIADRMTIVARQ
jgi:hypothetical protein